MPRLPKGAAVGWCVLMNGGSGETDGWRLSAIALQWQKFNATATVAEAAVLPLRPRVHSLLPPFPPPGVPPFTTPSIFPLVRCSYAPFNVQQNALFATTAASASNATFRRKWWVVKRGAEWKGWWKWAILTDRQHGWVFTLQLLCQSADLSIYINLLSSAIVVAAVVVYVTEAVAFSRNLQANFVSVAYHSKPPTPATGTTARWLTNNWYWLCST